jgi:hypothetical protein
MVHWKFFDQGSDSMAWKIAKNAGKTVFFPQIFGFPMVRKEVRGSLLYQRVRFAGFRHLSGPVSPPLFPK